MKALRTLAPALLAWCLVPVRAAVLPYGSELEVRLLHKVSSRISHLGDRVEATLISPFLDSGKVLIPAGSSVSGTIEHVDRLGLGLRHTAAKVDIHFTSLQRPDGTVTPINARIASVETARETVRTDGTVVGINPTANFSTGVSAAFAFAVLEESPLRVPILGFKFLAARSPDAEIFFPAGTEMLLRVEGSVELRAPATPSRDVPLLAGNELASVQRTLAALPEQQTNRARNHPSDLVNIVLIGSRGEVSRAFHAAGWTAPESHGVMALYHMFHCTVERKSYSQLPMSNLKLNGNVPDAAFEKSLDTFAKRHHIRLWHDDKAGVWLAAATEDTGFRWTKAHLTHATDRGIDNERAKVVNDLAFTGCVDRGALIPRTSLKPTQDQGSSIVTDGDVAVIELNHCTSFRGMPADPQRPVPVRAIRVAIAVGVDLARSNPVSVGYSMTKSALDRSKDRENMRIQAARIYTRPSAIASATATTNSGSLAVRE